MQTTINNIYIFINLFRVEVIGSFKAYTQRAKFELRKYLRGLIDSVTECIGYTGYFIPFMSPPIYKCYMNIFIFVQQLLVAILFE